MPPRNHSRRAVARRSTRRTPSPPSRRAKLAVRAPSGGQHGGFGWVPDLPDHRDSLFAFAPDPSVLKKLGTLTDLDLRKDRAMPPVWNQSQLGSCTAHAVGVCYAWASKKSKAHRRSFDPSRLWIYYQERVVEGTVNEDAGAMIRDGFKVCAKVGVAPERLWPYEIGKFTEQPPKAAATNALRHQSLVYRAVSQDLTSIKAALVSGYPVAIGFTVYESFESVEVANTGIVPMPLAQEAMLGGHAVALCGFHEGTQRFIVRNSWGTDWGQAGYFEMPYAYLLDPNLSDDFWIVTLTE